MTVALARKKTLTPMAQPYQRPRATQKPLQTATPAMARTAVSPANAVHVTAMAVNVVDAVSVATAAMRHLHLAQPKAKKARKLSTSCALPTSPSPRQRQRQRPCMPKRLCRPKRSLWPRPSKLRLLKHLLWWRNPHQ